ncbi:MAG: glycosyl transferase family 2 [Burkholderiales bacterium]|nr:glycosyl transferase family 2 [Burkholderiales bacterium]
MGELTYSVIIPVYKNEENISRLLSALRDMYITLEKRLEVVFVVDGSPDRSFEILKGELKNLPMPTQLIAHSRNFGSFPAIRTGLASARGNFFGVMAADLQEPPELLVQFFKSLASDECDVAIGTRSARNDPFFSRVASSIFWGLYRKLVVKDMPEGGIMMDSIFAFTDYPIRLLMKIGAVGSLLSICLALIIAIARAFGYIEVPGYAATILAILILGALNLFGLGLVGTYAWRGYENSKQRPLSVVSQKLTN